MKIVHTMSNKGDAPGAKDQWIESSEMKGLTSRNLVFMQTFAGAWPVIEFVQQAIAQWPCRIRPGGE
nr:hypothetical protein [Rhodoferax sp.]